VKPATAPRGEPLDERLLLVDPCGERLDDARVRDLEELLRPGDLVVVNDAATLPASLPATSPAGRAVELRLVSMVEEDLWWGVLFGEGDWRTPTEHRLPPEPMAPGERLHFGAGEGATVVEASPISPRLLSLRFDARGEELWSLLYRRGRPIQYSYLDRGLALWDVQSAFASRPWAVEPPSAGRPLRWSLLLALQRRGIAFATVTHAAGLSSTGDPVLDAALPLPERFDVPQATVDAVTFARRHGRRVVAVGTTVVRALESAARPDGVLRAGSGTTDLKLGPGFRPRVVNGLLTGLHEPGTSHFQLLRAFAEADLLERAWQHAEEHGYLAHEFGDSSLVLCS